MNKNIMTQINQLSLNLRLPSFRKDIAEAVKLAVKEKTSYEQLVLTLLQNEYDTRESNRKKAQLARAKFPQYKYLQDLCTDELPADGMAKLPDLQTLDFIAAGQNVILGGSPGTGKTHIAIGLGIKACQEGYSVLFMTVPELLTQIRESNSSRTLRVLEQKFKRYDLVICDEFGYITFDKLGSEMLFNHLSLRTGIKSTIITSNLSFDKWNDIFGKDPVLTAALLDRLTHKAYLVNMNGASYRMKETKKLLSQKAKKTTDN